MDAFITQAKQVRGESGEIWAKAIPQTISVYEKKWQITVGNPFSLSYNYAAPAKRADGSDAVLKIGFPGDSEFLSEAKALSLFNANAAINILEKDLDNSVLLLERVMPGKPLKTLGDNRRETEIAAGLAQTLWKKNISDPALIPLEKWYGGFYRYENVFSKEKQMLPKEVFLEGKTLFRQLLDTTVVSYLLHGDFHHDNILSSGENDWKIIDPKGVIGDPLYDISVFLYNPFDRILKNPLTKTLIAERIDIFANALSVDPARIKKWALAQAVLSAIWTLEDNGNTLEGMMRYIQLLENLG